MKRKFEVEVEKVDTYEIELDDEVIDEEFMNHFQKYFQDLETLEEHAEHIGIIRSNLKERFIEGYGNILVNGRKNFGVDENKVNKGVNVNVISEDYDVDASVREK